MLTDTHVNLLRDIVAEGALFVPESCTRVLCKPPATRSPQEVGFLRYNLVPAVPFLRELPDFVSAALVQHLRLKSVMSGDVVAKQGSAAKEVMLVMRGELRAYVHDRPALGIWDVLRMARQLAPSSGSPHASASEATMAAPDPSSPSSPRRGSGGLLIDALLLKNLRRQSARRIDDIFHRAKGSLRITTAIRREHDSPGSDDEQKARFDDAAETWAKGGVTEDACNGYEDLQNLEPHATHGELVANYVAHDVIGHEAAAGDPGSTYEATVVATRTAHLLVVTRDDFLRACARLRHRLVYSPARCRTTLVLPPSCRTPAQLKVVKQCLKQLEVSQ